MMHKIVIIICIITHTHIHTHMVVICSNSGPDSDSKYNDKYPFKLSPFQKHAINAITNNANILITAHTGSGKTLPAEFAIEYFTSIGKRVFYTSPIKSLSNQKYHDFTNKFPDISFGILTGDIKSNPDAQVVIMTTEILQNMKNDMYSDIGCVIFDEVHYINDADRGHVWEETIMKLPPQILLVLLSATMDNPNRFAEWIESRTDSLPVHIATTNERIVPLHHYTYVTCTNDVYKKERNESIRQKIKSLVSEPRLIKTTSSQKLNEQPLINNSFVIGKLREHSCDYVKRQHVLNNIAQYMVINNMLPAICFMFSRTQIEKSAEELTTVLLEDDSKIPYTIDEECMTIMRKLPNYKEYIHLPEYVKIVALLRKGIAFHHAGIIPVFREMLELLFSRGLIKFLFATETFSVGINMPTKTVVFSNLYKPTMESKSGRLLLPHEYSQMAGRAGRRGIDTIGHVIHLDNLIKPYGSVDFANMMKGTPQPLMSRFKISYPFILNELHNDKSVAELTGSISKSMIMDDLYGQNKTLTMTINELQNKIGLYYMGARANKTPQQALIEYALYCDDRSGCFENFNKSVRNMFSSTTQLLEKCLETYVDADINTDTPPNGDVLLCMYAMIEYIKDDTMPKDVHDIVYVLYNFIKSNELDKSWDTLTKYCDEICVGMLVCVSRLKCTSPYVDDIIQKLIVLCDKYYKKTGFKKKQSQSELKLIARRKKQLCEENNCIVAEYDAFINNNKQINQLFMTKKSIRSNINYIQNNIDVIVSLLSPTYINRESMKLTMVGEVSLLLREINPIIMSEMIVNTRKLSLLTPTEIVIVLSCFTAIRVQDDFKVLNIPSNASVPCKESIIYIEDGIKSFIDKELQYNYNNLECTELHYDIVNDCKLWCECTTEEECKLVFQSLKDKQIFVGDFVKAILKINAISNELMEAAKFIGDVELMKTLSEIPNITMKFIATNQSLYI